MHQINQNIATCFALVYVGRHELYKLVHLRTFPKLEITLIDLLYSALVERIELCDIVAARNYESYGRVRCSACGHENDTHTITNKNMFLKIYLKNT